MVPAYHVFVLSSHLLHKKTRQVTRATGLCRVEGIQEPVGPHRPGEHHLFSSKTQQLIGAIKQRN